MNVKLLSAVDPQIMQNNAGKQFSTCKYKESRESNFYVPGTVLKQFGQ